MTIRSIPCPAPRWPKSARRCAGSSLPATLGAAAPGAGAEPAAHPRHRDREPAQRLRQADLPAPPASAPGRIKVRIVQNDAFNAFVLDGRNVFVHTGTLMQAQTPNEVIGVIAHETGHITGGHMAALRARIAKDQTRALLAQILGIGLMVAGGVAGGDTARDLGGAGQGVLYGGNEIIMRSLLAERRQQESAADQAGLTFLNATKQSGRGMLATFERFAQQEYISDAQKDAFARSHPLSTDRLARLRQLVETSPYYSAKDPPQLQLRHDLMRAKLSGYLERPQVVFNRYPPTDTDAAGPLCARHRPLLPGRPGRASRRRSPRSTGCSREQPDNPYFWEVKGDLLMRAGQDARGDPAAAPGAEARSRRQPHPRAARRRPAGGRQPGGHRRIRRAAAQVARSTTRTRAPTACWPTATTSRASGPRPTP